MPESLPYDETLIAERVQRVRDEMARHCEKARRDPAAVTLVAVTKTHPDEAVRAAWTAGVRHFGENRVQELVQKARLHPGVVQGGNVHWHHIGHLQTNKARDVVRYAELFHALDTVRLAEEIDRRAEAEGRVMPCLVQVNVSGEASKFGVAPADAHLFVEKLAACRHIVVRGLMAIAAPTPDPERVRGQFRLLRQTMHTFAAHRNPAAQLDFLSMGMSGDFGVAIEEGATHVRLGSALFGARG